MEVRRHLSKGAAMAAVLCLFGGAPAAAQSSAAKSTPVSVAEWTAAKPFLDKAGGYRDSRGGYYDPAAGTFTDSTGGVVDNWRGYTYVDGSYKSGLGDYFDANKRQVATTDGRIQKLPAGMTNAQILALMRQNVEQNDGFDQNLTSRGMIQAIQNDHPGAGRP